MFPESWLLLERAGAALLLFSAGALAGARWGRTPAMTAGVALLALVLSIPFRAGRAFDVVVATFGAPSAASLLLLGALLHRGLFAHNGSQPPPLLPLAIVVVALGLAFYPPVLGLGAFDPYRLGYAGLALPAACLVLLALAWLLRAPIVAMWLLIAAIISLSGLHPSLNFWDHLIDPVATLIALALLAAHLIRRGCSAP